MHRTAGERSAAQPPHPPPSTLCLPPSTLHPFDPPPSTLHPPLSTPAPFHPFYPLPLTLGRVQRAGTTVAASNSDRASPLRTWDLATGALTDRFVLPSFCAGVRCLQLHGHALVAGCGNGWVVLCDLRSGRWERKVAIPEMVNTLEWRGDMLLTGGDDGVVRLSDVGTFATISAHRVGRCVFAARFDRTRIYAGCDNGEVRVFDYSSRPESAHAVGEGGFTPRQKQALFTAFFERPQSFGAHADV